MNTFNKVTFFVLLIVVPCNGQGKLSELSQKTETTVQQVRQVNPNDTLFRIENNNNHKIVVNNQDDPNDCSRYVGEELRTRMRWLEVEDLKKNLINFGPQKRILYASSLQNSDVVNLVNRLGIAGRAEVLQKINDPSGQEFFKLLDKRIAAMQMTPGDMVAIGLLVVTSFAAITCGAIKPSEAIESIAQSRNALFMNRYNKEQA